MNNTNNNKERKERQSIFPLSKMANSVGSSLFEGNDRDLAWNREICTGGYKENSDSDHGHRDMPKELHFISLREERK